MIVCEKLRAICQQMPEYRQVVESTSQVPRPRDFFDIYNIVEKFGIDITEPSTIDILLCMFEVKKVPLQLLGQINYFREFHRSAFSSLESTVTPDAGLKDFDFYFDYVVDLVGSLKALWEK
jgi:hypothetical protein